MYTKFSFFKKAFDFIRSARISSSVFFLLNMSIPTALAEYTVAEHKRLQVIKSPEYVKAQEAVKQEDKQLRETRTKLKTELLEFMENNKIKCLPTGLTDSEGKTLFLRLGTQSAAQQPNIERVTAAINRIDTSVLDSAMIELQKTLSKKNKVVGNKRIKGEEKEDLVLVFKKKKTQDGHSVDVKSEYSVTAGPQVSAAAASDDVTCEEPWALQVLKIAIKKQIRETHTVKKIIPELSTSQMRGFKMDPLEAKSMYTKDLESKCVMFREIGKDISSRTAHKKSVQKKSIVPVEVQEKHEQQREEVKSFLLTHGDTNNANSRKIVVDDQAYRLKVATTNKVKPLTLPLVDSMINIFLKQALVTQVQNLQDLNVENTDWSKIWTDTFKVQLLAQVIDEMSKWKSTQRIVSQEVKMLSLKSRRKRPSVNGDAEGEEEEEEEEDDENQDDNDDNDEQDVE